MVTENKYFIEWLYSKYNKLYNELTRPEKMGYLIDFIIDHRGSIEINKYYNKEMIENSLEKEAAIIKQ